MLGGYCVSESLIDMAATLFLLRILILHFVTNPWRIDTYSSLKWVHASLHPSQFNKEALVLQVGWKRGNNWGKYWEQQILKFDSSTACPRNTVTWQPPRNVLETEDHADPRYWYFVSLIKFIDMPATMSLQSWFSIFYYSMTHRYIVITKICSYLVLLYQKQFTTPK